LDNLDLLTNLQTLDLSGTKLTSLPPEIRYLSSLQNLNLSLDNRLTSLPSEIGDLTNLQILNLCGTDITRLPPELKYLTRLQRIFLNDKDVIEIPPGIRNDIIRY
jgi:Leucine-rich repeat (LRR) protein